MALTMVTAPSVEPVSLADAKTHLRVSVSDDDDLITALIATARQWAEAFTRRALITQVWDLFLAEWPEDDEFEIPLPPLQSVTSVTYKDTDGNSSTFSSDDYIVDTDSEPGRVVLAYGESWPSTSLYPSNPITVRFTAGYGDAATDVPEAIRQAILLLVGHLYENREGTIGVGNMQVLPLGVEALLWPYRVLEF